MAAKVTSSSEYASNLLKLVFTQVGYANIADNASSSPFTNLYVSLHTASPAANGNQTMFEAAYGAYARVAVARTTTGWTVTNNTVVPAATIIFPAATSGAETELFFGIGTNSTVSNAGHLLYFGSISPTIVVSNGVTPELTTGSTITEV